MQNQDFSVTENHSTVGLKAFFHITNLWGLTAQEERILLGDPSASNFHEWRNGEGPVVPKETLERISYVMGIYKALRTLYPTEERACAWPKKSNRHFGGKSALEVMLSGRLKEVRQYLDGQCQ